MGLKTFLRSELEISNCPVKFAAKNLKANFTACELLGSWVSLWNFETIRGSLMKPKWQKLASLAQEICTL